MSHWKIVISFKFESLQKDGGSSRRFLKQLAAKLELVLLIEVDE